VVPLVNRSEFGTDAGIEEGLIDRDVARPQFATRSCCSRRGASCKSRRCSGPPRTCRSNRCLRQDRGGVRSCKPRAPSYGRTRIRRFPRSCAIGIDATAGNDGRTWSAAARHRWRCRHSMPVLCRPMAPNSHGTGRWVTARAVAFHTGSTSCWIRTSLFRLLNVPKPGMLRLPRFSGHAG